MGFCHCKKTGIVPEEDSSAIGEKEIIIRGSDLNHMKNVLRLQIGEQICIHEESTGKEYRCEIAGYEKDVAHLHIMWVEEANRELPSKIYLFQGLPKGDKMDSESSRAWSV